MVFVWEISNKKKKTLYNKEGRGIVLELSNEREREIRKVDE
jgi:hypothetical protein